MGNARSALPAAVHENPNRVVFIEYAGFQRVHRSRFSTFTLNVRYLRYRWQVIKRFREIKNLDSHLERKYPTQVERIIKPSSHYQALFRGQDHNFLINRGREFAVYIQLLCDNPMMFYTDEVQEFLEIGPVLGSSKVYR